ncbi:MAG: tetratricopeptide repeat protein [Acidobacteriota bacterium]
MKNPRLALGALAFAALTLAACGPSAPPLGEVPKPATQDFEPAVKAQLEAAFEAVESSELTDRQRADAYGELARTLHAYELRESGEAAYRNARSLAPSAFEWSYLLGVVLQELGTLEEAAKVFGRALEIQPENLPARVRLADVLLKANRLDAAEAELKLALDQDPQCALAHYFSGQIALERGDAEAAVGSYLRVLELQPQADRLYNSLARAYRSLGDLEKTASALERAGAREVFLEDPLYIALQELELSSAAFVRRAGRAQFAGAGETAIQLYRRAVETSPINAEARAGLGASLAQIGQLEEALEHLEAALEHGEESAWVRYNIAGVHRMAGQSAPALANYRAAVEIEPDYLDAWVGLAQILAAGGRFDEAIQNLESRIPAGRDLPTLHLELASIHLAAAASASSAAVRKRRLEAVRSAHRAALDADPKAGERAAVFRQRAQMAQARGDLSGALEELQRALEAKPEDLEAAFMRANLLGAEGRFDEAASAYRSLLRAAPGYRAARIGEAIALSLAGRGREAAERLGQGLESSPGDPELSHALARLLLESSDPSLRNPQRALELLQTATRGGGTVAMAESQAWALAEIGRLGEAVALQEQVIAELRRVGQETAAASARLEDYRRRQRDAP